MYSDILYKVSCCVTAGLGPGPDRMDEGKAPSRGAKGHGGVAGGLVGGSQCRLSDSRCASTTTIRRSCSSYLCVVPLPLEVWSERVR